MAYEKAEPTAVCIKYLMELLKLSGFGFNLSRCAVCEKSLSNETSVGFVYEGSGVVCAHDKSRVDNMNLTSSEWGILKNISNISVDLLHGLKFSSRESLTDCLKLMLKQYYFRTGEKLKCLESYF